MSLIKNKTLKNISNILWFQLGWWSLILSASNDFTKAPSIITSLLLLLHFLVISTDQKRDLILMTLLTPVGIIGEYFLLNMGVYQIPSVTSSVPFWLVSLWLLFPLTLPYSMIFFIQNTKLIPVLGLIAGSTYLVGETFGVLYLSPPQCLYFLLPSLFWMAFLLLSHAVLKKIEN